jgi:hypothetical protein
MKLTSKAGREIELDDQHSAEYLNVLAARGESCARSAAFRGTLHGQITREMQAARERAYVWKLIAKKERFRRIEEEFLRYEAFAQGLRQIAPGIHRYAETRIVNCGRKLPPGYVFRDRFRECRPTLWRELERARKRTAMKLLYQVLWKLNANDWEHIRPLVDAKAFGCLLKRSNPDVLGSLL